MNEQKPKQPQGDDLLTRCMSIGEVCQHLGLCRQTVYRLIRRGELRSCHVGGALRVRQVELLRYLESQERREAKRHGLK